LNLIRENDAYQAAMKTGGTLKKAMSGECKTDTVSDERKE
jgi:hypothetical protein